MTQTLATQMKEVRIPGPKILLMGDSGSGKTYSIKTLVEAGLEVFVIFTEPGMEVLRDTDPDKVHWHYVAPVKQDWARLKTSAKNINTMSYEMLTKAKDSQKTKHTQFFDILELCNNFSCQRTNKEFGDVSKFGNDRVLVLDSLTGLNQIINDLAVGNKPVKAMQEWQIIQNMLKQFLDTITTDLKCTFVLTAHLSREKDEITGGTQIMVNAPGKALAPSIPLYFSDVIRTVRTGSDFRWSTSEANVVTKARNVDISSKLEPSFIPLLREWLNN